MSEDAKRRFDYEACILGQLGHPGIAQIYEAGTFQTDEGIQPFFSMEFVQGEPLTVYAAGKRLSTRDRLRLVAEICDAVSHAHQKRIIHRDLKPANIVVGMTGKSKILDFGVARATDTEIHPATMHTQFGQLVGTLPYMSPEQVAGDPDDLDVRSDVYSIGVVAYELLSERLPYDVSGKSIQEVVRTICEVEPVRLGALNRDCRGDIETIIAKSTEKERDSRYESVADFAEDIRRHLNGQPIHARATSIWQRTVKWARRRPAEAALITSVPVALLILAFAAFQSHRSVTLHHEAQEYAQAREQAAEFAKQRDVVAQQESKRADEEAKKARHKEDEASHAEYFKLIAQADIEAQRGNRSRLVDLLSRCPKSRRGWEWYRLQHFANQGARTVSLGKGTQFAALGPFGDHIVAGQMSGIHVWDREGAFVALAQHYATTGFTAAAFSPDGKQFAAGEGSPTTGESSAQRAEFVQLTLYDTATGRVNSAFLTTSNDYLHSLDEVRAIAFSPDGRWIAAGGKFGNAGNVQLWQVSSEELVRVFHGVHLFGVNAIAFSHNGETIASGGMDGTIKIWDWDKDNGGDAIAIDASSGKPLKERLLAIGPGGERIVGGTEDDESRLISLQEAFPVWCVAFDPADRRLAAAGRAGLLNIWDTANGREILHLEGHVRDVAVVAFSADGTRLVSGDEDGNLKVWDSASGDMLASFLAHEGAIQVVAFGADDNEIISAGIDGSARFWRVPQSRQNAGHRNAVIAVAFTPDGKEILSHSSGHDLRRWSSTLTGPSASVSYDPHAFYRVHSVAFDPDRQRFACLNGEATVSIRELISGREILVLRGHESAATSCAFSPDGQEFAAGSKDGKLIVWDAATGTQLLSYQGHSTEVHALIFASNGKRIISGGADGKLMIWDLASNREFKTLDDHKGIVRCIDCNYNQERIVSGSADGALMLWDTSSGTKLATMAGHDGEVGSVAFSPEGSRIISGGDDATVKIWDSQTGKEYLTLRGHTGAVLSLTMSPDGKSIVSGGADNQVRIWDSSLLALSTLETAADWRKIFDRINSERTFHDPVEGFALIIGLGEQAVPRLVEDLSDHNPRTRAAACAILKILGPKARSAVSLLERAAHDPDAFVRLKAKAALLAVDDNKN
jgi:WD40 repeat protein